jgi:hypothetical protein
VSRPPSLIIFFCLASGIASAATLCHPDESVVYSCKIKGSSKIASVCSSLNFDRDKGYLQYRFGAPGRIELIYPKSKIGSQKLFFWRELRPYHSSVRELTFKSGPYFYTLSAYDVSEELNDIKGGAQLGDLVVEKTGGSGDVRSLKCAAFPEGKFNLFGVVEDGDDLIGH